jgi:hypothetical protein
VFTDASVEQISMIRLFFLARGIHPSNVLKTSKGTAWIIAIGTYDGVLAALKGMLPYLFKKSNEAEAAIDYYEDRITGNDLLAILEQDVIAGRRERHLRKVRIDAPFTFFQGDRLMKERRKEVLRDAFGRFRAKVTPKDFESIRKKHYDKGERLCHLAREYPQYARETIRRVLGGGRGYVGVAGKGRVDTGDSR